MVSLALLLCGLWTVIAGFVIVETKDRSYYSGWGVVIAALSLSYFVQLQYALALVLLAVVALIIINVYLGKTPKINTAATSPPSPAGDAPAAKIYAASS
jgi:hypothetical protein